ncbi:MAG: exonuclease domain-containing protein [Candidatus Zixiibacteriota bacterium]
MSNLPVLSDYLKRQVFVAFDTETTGMWAPINRLVELAAVKFTLEDGPIETFQSLINPLRPVPEEVIEIHGITDEMVAGSPTADRVLSDFLGFCGPESILIAHNAPFDISFVGTELDRSKLTFGENPILDTVDIYHRFFPGLPSYSLLNLVRHFRISDSQAHRALSDAEFVYRLVANAAHKFADLPDSSALMKTLTVYKMTDWESEKAELPDNFADLQLAINTDGRVMIDYDHPVKPSTNRIIHPQQVFRLGSVYYINAFCEKAKAARTFRLDRIKRYRIVQDSEGND